MNAKHRRCCGIDVHKSSATVGVLAPAGQPHVGVKKRTFTRDLRQLRAWLKNCQVTGIAMESTGQYRRPLWNLLEGEFAKLILVNPRHIKGLNGYKTDPRDAEYDNGPVDILLVERAANSLADRGEVEAVVQTAGTGGAVIVDDPWYERSPNAFAAISTYAVGPQTVL